jgi:hypothetical protein
VAAPTALPAVSDLQAFLGGNVTVDPTQGAALIAWIAQLASAATRGVGFTNGIPNADLWSLIVGAAARIYAHARQLSLSQAEGQESFDVRQGFQGWSVAEQYVIRRYRRMAE